MTDETTTPAILLISTRSCYGRQRHASRRESPHSWLCGRANGGMAMPIGPLFVAGRSKMWVHCERCRSAAADLIAKGAHGDD